MADDDKEIQVSPEMLRTFAKNIRELHPNITTARGELAKVNLRAGNFPGGTSFAKLVGLDPSGRATKYDQTLGHLYTAIEQLATGIETIANNYTTTEEMNKHLNEDLGNVMALVAPTLGTSAPPNSNSNPNSDSNNGNQ
ncbi:MAG: hypothetical protein V7637_701 [Mycobacteriales bacterium]|jgi:uncharacterized protein YukE